jgi:hypothetical protein
MEKLTIEFCNRVARQMGFENYFSALWACSPEQLEPVNKAIREAHGKQPGTYGQEMRKNHFTPIVSIRSLTPEEISELKERREGLTYSKTFEIPSPIREALNERAKNFFNKAPEDWSVSAPAYDSSEGWQFEKSLADSRMRCKLVTIPWLLEMGTPKHLLIANRLKEILA